MEKTQEKQAAYKYSSLDDLQTSKNDAIAGPKYKKNAKESYAEH